MSSWLVLIHSLKNSPLPDTMRPIGVTWICLKIGYSQMYRFIIVFLIFFLLNCHMFVACRYPPFFRHTYLLVTLGPGTDLPSCWVLDDCYPVCCVPGDGAGLNEDTDVFVLICRKAYEIFRPTYLYGRVVGFNKYWTRGLTHQEATV